MKADVVKYETKEKRENYALQLLLSYLHESESCSWIVDDFFSFDKEKFKLQIDNQSGPNYLSAKWGTGITVIEGFYTIENLPEYMKILQKKKSYSTKDGSLHFHDNIQDTMNFVDTIFNKICDENKATTDYVPMPHQYLMVYGCSSLLADEDLFRVLTDRVASLTFQTMIYDRIYLGFVDQTVRLVYAK